jgi:hypothetical protein
MTVSNGIDSSAYSDKSIDGGCCFFAFMQDSGTCVFAAL